MKYLKKYWLIICVVFLLFSFYKPAICFILLGAIAFTLGLYHLHFLTSIQKNGVITKGKILSYKPDDFGYKIPIIEFNTLNNKKVIREEPFYYTATDLSIILDYKTDKVISVTYSQNSPKKFIINKDSKYSYTGLLSVTVIGLLFIVVGIAQLFNYIDLGF